MSLRVPLFLILPATSRRFRPGESAQEMRWNPPDRLLLQTSLRSAGSSCIRGKKSFPKEIKICRRMRYYNNRQIKRRHDEGNPDKEVFPVGDNRMMRERHAVVSFSYLLYSGDKSISPIKV